MAELAPTPMLAAAKPINVGDVVRSYDFPDDLRWDAQGCYVEGTVMTIGRFEFDNKSCDRYKIRVTKRVWLNKPEAVREPYVFPPVNGTLIAGRAGKVTFGVVKVPA